MVAREQTAGRARRGRAWSSLRGNLFASFVWRESAHQDRIGELPLIASLSLAEAVDATSGIYGRVKLKWPNDLLIDGSKISGILLEAETFDSNSRLIVCGFGVNCVAHPDLGEYPTTSLMQQGLRVDADHLFTQLAKSFECNLMKWRHFRFAEMRQEWIERAVGVGKPIRVRLPDQELSGLFQGLADDGRLRLRRANGIEQLISAGDVFF